MSDLEDLKQADFWAAMAFNKDTGSQENHDRSHKRKKRISS